MVTARAVESYFKRRLTKDRDRIKAEGRKEGIEEYADYIRRRDEARAKGEDFDELPPSP